MQNGTFEYMISTHETKKLLNGINLLHDVVLIICFNLGSEIIIFSTLRDRRDADITGIVIGKI